MTRNRAHLNEAVRGYERGFYLRNDYYNGINFAYLLNVRASSSCRRAEAARSPEEATRLRGDAVACFVHAGKVRGEVLKLCETVLQMEKLSDSDKYWVLATMAEASLGIGDAERAERTLQEVLAVASAEWMRDSTQEQTDKLRHLLADSRSDSYRRTADRGLLPPPPGFFRLRARSRARGSAQHTASRRRAGGAPAGRIRSIEEVTVEGARGRRGPTLRVAAVGNRPPPALFGKNLGTSGGLTEAGFGSPRHAAG